LVISGVLLHPAVYWQLYGWAQGEPFCFGWPATFWSREVQKKAIGKRVQHITRTSGPRIVVEKHHYAETFVFLESDPAPANFFEHVFEWLDRATRGRIVPKAEELV